VCEARQLVAHVATRTPEFRRRNNTKVGIGLSTIQRRVGEERSVSNHAAQKGEGTLEKLGLEMSELVVF
jgi:hypothetical protein